MSKKRGALELLLAAMMRGLGLTDISSGNPMGKEGKEGEGTFCVLS